MNLKLYKRLFVRMSNDYGYKTNIDDMIGIDYFLPIIKNKRKLSISTIESRWGKRKFYIYICNI